METARRAQTFSVSQNRTSGARLNLYKRAQKSEFSYEENLIE